jgi:hypothetical protein
MTSLVPTNISRNEAIALTRRIRDAAEDLWRFLHEAHERRAWEALGYPTWAAYVESEFDFTKRHANRLVAHAEIVQAIEAEVGPVGPILTEGQTRGLRGKLPEIVAGVQVVVRDGQEPGAAAAQVVRVAQTGEISGVLSDITTTARVDESKNQTPREIAKDFVVVVTNSLNFYVNQVVSTDKKAAEAVRRLTRILDWVEENSDSNAFMVESARRIQRRYEAATAPKE